MDLEDLLGILCTLASFCFQLVGVQICYGVVKRGSTGDLSPFTFIMYFVACAVWLKYALIQNIFVVIITNLYGAVLNLIYSIILYRYSQKKQQFHMYILIGALILLSPLVYIKYYQTDLDLAITHLGSYCVCLTVIGYAAPFVSLTDVIKSKSTESLSFILILANCLVSIMWTLYGGLIHDKYVQMPSLLGFFSGCYTTVIVCHLSFQVEVKHNSFIAWVLSFICLYFCFNKHTVKALI